MNYIKTIPFIICFVVDNYILGTAFLKLFKIEKRTFEKKIVCGFFLQFLFGFLIGLPSQVFSISWNSFFVIFSIANVLFLILCIKLTSDELRKDLRRIRENPKKIIVNHLKKRWFIYLIVILFSVLSILNTQPYLWCNYHDDYYITKVVNLQGAPHLLNEAYETGSIIANNSRFALFKAQGYRGFNTYELIYAYLGSVFNIDLAFFCRFSLCIYIYLITFFVYKILAEELLENSNTTQFALVFFCLLMVPTGYASAQKISVRMFENWRFQTAIFYGGSIIRTLALPLYCLVFKRVYEKFSIRRLLLVLLLIVTLISFQISAVTYLLFMLPIFLFLLLFKALNYKAKGSRKIKTMIILIALFVMLIIISDQLFSIIVSDKSKYNNMIQNYLPYYNDIFICDIFALTAFIPIICKLYNDLRKNKAIVIDLTIFFAYLIFRLNAADFYLGLISIFRFYSILRILTSVLLLVVLYWGIFFQETLTILIKRKSNVLLSVLCFSLSVSTILNIKLNEKNVIKYTAAAQSATPQGYSFKILTSNDKMLPDLIANVGNYFNKLPYGNYRLISEGHIPYKNTYIDNESLLLASNRIELAYQSTDNDDNTGYGLIQLYLKGKIMFSDVEGSLNIIKIQYVLTTRKNIADDLALHNYQIVYHDKVNNSWVLKK